MTPIDLHLCPRKSALLLGHDNKLDVLVRVAGPPPPREAPAKTVLNLALVIDKSGSMKGKPLHEAKRCAIAIIEQLAPGDFVSVVAYDNHPELVWPARAVASAAGLKEAVSAIREGGSTDLHGGWAAGAEQAALSVSKAGISRVLLLSDGCANAGLTDPGQIASHCAQMAEMGVSTSTYGLGAGFNEALMLAMARSGGGNGYYGQNAADLMEHFQAEFDLLRAICARDLRLRLWAGPGVKLRVANDLRESDGGWRLPDLAYGSEAWAMVRLSLHMDRVAGGEQAPIPLLRASLGYETTGGSGVAGPVSLALPSLPVAAYVALVEDEAVARRAQEVRFAKFQRDAAEAATQGDWIRVERVLEKARTEARGNAWLTASLASLERYAEARNREQFAKEAAFKSERMMSRLSASGESGGFSDVSELAQPSFLRRRPEEGKTGPGG